MPLRVGKTTLKSEAESLKEPETAARYLTPCLEGGNPEVFLFALRDVTEARGGIRILSKQTQLNRDTSIGCCPNRETQL
jgi:DNA-binding phage protein